MSLRRFYCLILVLATSLAYAEKPEENDAQRWLKTDRENLPPPAEQTFQMPDLAKLNDWRVYPVGRDMGSTRVEIAVDSVSIGKEDRILRYAIAIIPKTGLRNVFFEGLDCYTSRYRDYAWGNPDQTWRKTETVVWRVAQKGVRNVWQGALVEDFCGDTGPYSRDTILSSLQKGKQPPKGKD
ncbi:MAG: CNP1-like family protein [Formivibrio sp.]|nr:CNP1-like family protein [Formivibrio sp.]